MLALFFPRRNKYVCRQLKGGTFPGANSTKCALSSSLILSFETIVIMMYRQLLRCSTARGYSTGLSLVGPAKVKAPKSIIFIEGAPEVENNLPYLQGLTVSLYHVYSKQFI